MTSITTRAHASHVSPRDRLQKELESEISSGTIKSTDANALSKALDAIDEAVKAQHAAGASSTETATTPEDMRSKISDLIDGRVEDGSLTSDQASELKQLFTKAAPQGGHGGPGGPGGAGGPPPAPPQGDASASDDSTSSSPDLAELLKTFLKQLQESSSTTTSYGTDGSANGSNAVALVLDTAA